MLMISHVSIVRLLFRCLEIFVLYDSILPFLLEDDVDDVALLVLSSNRSILFTSKAC
jgi:hypothetical protein